MLADRDAPSGLSLASSVVHRKSATNDTSDYLLAVPLNFLVAFTVIARTIICLTVGTASAEAVGAGVGGAGGATGAASVGAG